MAKKYDYSNVEFAKRIKLRKDIMTLNRVISGIVYSIGYPANVFIYISEKYYNQTRGEIVKDYPEGANPVDYLNSKALYHYREYLNNIILHWDNRKLTLSEFKPTDFSLSIEECAKIARKQAKENGALPHSNLASKLPANISGAMIKKADHTLTQANFVDGEFNREIVESRQKTRKKPTPKKVVVDKNQIKSAVKEAIEDLALENQLKAVKEKLDTKQKKQDVNLFNYKEVYDLNNKDKDKDKGNKQTKNEPVLTEEEIIEHLQNNINKTEKFLKTIEFNKDHSRNQQMQLKAQDYYDTHFETKQQELMEMKQKLELLEEKQPKVKER